MVEVNDVYANYALFVTDAQVRHNVCRAKNSPPYEGGVAAASARVVLPFIITKKGPLLFCPL